MSRITLLLASGVAALLACDTGSDPLGVELSAAHVAALAAHTYDIKQTSSGTSEILGWCDRRPVVPPRRRATAAPHVDRSVSNGPLPDPPRA
jgi:hypothetical protein